MDLKKRFIRTFGYLIGSVLILFALNAGRHVALLKARGVSAEVEAMSNHTVWGGRRSGSGLHYATVTFTTARAEKITERRRVPTAAFNNFNSHMSVTVRYDAASPRDFAFELEGTPWNWFGLGVYFIVLGWWFGSSRR